MFKKTVIGLMVALVLLVPSGVLLGIAVLLNPATSCLPGGSLAVGPTPDSLAAITTDGQTITLDKTQLTHAATIITVGGDTNGVGREGVVVALMAALTESSLRMLANTASHPESGDFPNDGNGSDHDSLGLFQMRPQAGWGTVAELMDPIYQARAFYGGSTGPNYPSPRGLLDITAWQQLLPGVAAQSVEASAHPDRYATYQPVADKILTTLTAGADLGGGGASPNATAPETSQVVFPLPAGTGIASAGFGPRIDPINGTASFHHGTDYAAPAGTPILAAADGRVVFAGMDGGTGTIRVLHTIGGQPVSTTYLHMWADGINVDAGQTVSAGQQIGEVGSSGHSTGPHLHFEVHPGGTNSPAVDSAAWLAAHGAGWTEGSNGSAGCTTYMFGSQ